MSINNKSSYSFTNADLVDLVYTEQDLTFLLTKLTTDSSKQITSYTDDNQVVIIKLNSSNTKYWLLDLSYSFNKTLYSLLKNIRYDATYPFGLKFNIYDDRVQTSIVSLTDQNINQAYEYIQYSNPTPLSVLPHSITFDFTPVFSNDKPTFKDNVNIDGSAPALNFVDGANTDWSLKQDGSNNLGFYRGGTENILSMNRDTGAMTLTKGLTINNPSPALILNGTIGSNTFSGGMQSNINGEVAVASFTNHNLSFFLNGANANMYKIASMKTNKTMEVNGGFYINKSTTGTPVFSTDDSTSSTSVWGELYKKNPSRVTCSVSTFNFNLPSNIPTIIPFNQVLIQQGNKVNLNTTTGLITLSEIGMYHIYFTWAPHDIVNTRMNASYVMRNPAGVISTGPTTLSNNGDSCQLSNTIYVGSAPSTIEFIGMHYLNSNMRLATSTSVGSYWTYSAVMFLY
jgi:hypothetical protein